MPYSVTQTNVITQTESATTTTTVTTTTVSIVPTYAACANNNILSIAPDGERISNIFNNGNGQPQGTSIYDNVPNVASAYDCCVLCQQAAGCQASGLNAETGRCVLLHNQQRTCPAQSSAQVVFISEEVSAEFYTISNGQCGFLEFFQT